MSYVVVKQKEELKLNNHNISINGLNVKPKNVENNIIINNIIISDEKLSNNYIKKRINKKIDNLIKKMMIILNSDESSSSDAAIILDELSRLKGIIFNKYKEHMIESEYKALISKIILLEEKFKKDYNQKMFQNHLKNVIMNGYNDEYKEGRSR